MTHRLLERFARAEILFSSKEKAPGMRKFIPINDRLRPFLTPLKDKRAIVKRSLFITLLIVMLVSLFACKSKTRVPPPISPPTAAPSPGLPSSTPTGEQSSSTPTGGQSSSTPTGGQSSREDQQPGAAGSQDKAQRESAGDDLRNSGEMIANSGTRIGDQATATEASESPGQDEPDTLLPESDASAIERAQDALEAAGDSLTKAGDAVADAVTEEELALAEAQLADARIAVIIAEQEIGSLKDSPYYEDAAELVEIEAALEQANVVLVVATRAVLNARTGMPDFPAAVPDQAILTNSQGEVAVLEGELEGSLEIFDDRMNRARSAAIAATGVAITPIKGSDASAGGINSPATTAKEEESQAMEPEEKPVVVAVNSDVPEDIPSAQGDDIVAQQLREAAIAETNPALQEKLWVEYKRYKAGL